MRRRLGLLGGWGFGVFVMCVEVLGEGGNTSFAMLSYVSERPRRIPFPLTSTTTYTKHEGHVMRLGGR